jgi:outer membrane lipoprotein-sorting protein
MVKRFLLLLSIALMASAFNKQYIFQKISMDMEVRSASGRNSIRSKASIYYTSEGKMVSYFAEPQEMVVINNRKGEITAYNPADNTVFKQQNYTQGTETDQLFYFLDNKRSDLGLTAMGYGVKSTKIEDGLKVTEWSPPVNLSGSIKKVELVHERGNPIYLGYHAANGAIVKKIFFYNYEKVGDYILLPKAVTQIDFKSPTDSVVTKTVYSEFRLNQQVLDDKLSFEIPADAKLIR